MLLLLDDTTPSKEATWDDDEELDRLLGHAIQSSRGLAVELDPPLDPDEGLGPFLSWVTGRIESEQGLHVRIKGEELNEPLPRLHAVLFARAARREQGRNEQEAA